MKNENTKIKRYGYAMAGRLYFWCFTEFPKIAFYRKMLFSMKEVLLCSEELIKKISKSFYPHDDKMINFHFSSKSDAEGILSDLKLEWSLIRKVRNCVLSKTFP